jgi:uncharacterized protein
MILPDVNLLIYAHDETSPFHEKARLWWESALSGREPIGIPVVVALAFVRLVTHPTINQNPMTVAMARERVESWEKVPIVSLLSGSALTLRLVWEFLEAAEAGGNLTTDAMIAAHASERGGTVYSNDRDFDRFPKIRWINPLRE